MFRSRAPLPMAPIRSDLPSLLRRARSHWRKRGAAHVLRLIARRLVDPLLRTPPDPTPLTSDALAHARFPDAVPLLLRPPFGARPPRRVNVVTDTISPPDLFGGVATSLILGALLAERHALELRVITRVTPPDVHHVAHVLGVAGVARPAHVTTVFAPYLHPELAVEAHPEELFLTTSWWTTAGTLATVPAHRVVYLLQEDERMFYPHGDRHLRCAELLARPGPTVVVNTRMLFEHLGDSGLPHIAEHGRWFEPAFPRTAYFAEASAAASSATSPARRRRFFFYARGRHDRNLFTRGVEAVDRALAEGVLDPSRWELHFVGSAIPPLCLARGAAIHRHENLPWADYARLVRTMDLGLSLMYTPHPSYPPLDLAASGAVVVTNRFGPKRDLSRYSANILCVDTRVEDLVAGLAQGVALATDDARRLANLRADHIARDWSETLAPVLDAIASRHGLAS